MPTINITLGRDTGLSDFSEGDYESWVSYVTCKIVNYFDTEAISVHPRDGNEGVQTDHVFAAGDPELEEEVRDAIADLWDSWCGERYVSGARP